MREPHAFSKFVGILGRGKTLSRSLTEAEAEEAMGMILDGEALPEQIGALLMLLRLKEESPEEIAGFVRAARARLATTSPAPRVDIDWSSYAGKKRQLPWFLLAALRLASAGWRVMMQGGEGHTEGRLYTSQALRALGMAPDADLTAAAHLSAVDYLGDVPWDEDETARNWYARIKSRPSFRMLLTETLPGLPPSPSYANLYF